jgi:hypothetical protein
VGGDSSARELAGAPGPAASHGDDDAARCGGQGPRSAASTATETRAEARTAWMRRGANKARFSLCLATHGDIVARPRGAAVTGSDRRRWPLCSEHGHRLVTGSMEGNVGPGIELPD